MVSPETSSVVVCAIFPKDLDTAVRVVREVGSWTVVPIQWDDPSAFSATRDTANAFILHTGYEADVPSDELMSSLAARPKGVPLIVFGGDPARGAAPTCWLPSMPAGAFLAALLSQLITSGDSVASG